MAATNYAKSVVYKTQRPGTVDRFTYLQSAKANAPRGQDLPQTKLLDLDIVSIRSAAKQRENLRKHIRDNLSNEALAKQYGVHVRTIEKCLAYETGSHVV
jgi:hypothetical protein